MTGDTGNAVRIAALWLVIAGLAACKPMGMHLIEPPSRADFSAEMVRMPPDQTGTQDGVCWAQDTLPMTVETVTDQVMVQPARTDAYGQITSPAIYRTDTHQKIVQERQEIWFRVPCASETSRPDFVPSLQRALKARAYYLLPVSGFMDEATRNAIHRFQTDRGLDSPVLSLAAARELGLIAVDQTVLQ